MISWVVENLNSLLLGIAAGLIVSFLLFITRPVRAFFGWLLSWLHAALAPLSIRGTWVAEFWRQDCCGEPRQGEAEDRKQSCCGEPRQGEAEDRKQGCCGSRQGKVEVFKVQQFRHWVWGTVIYPEKESRKYRFNGTIKAGVLVATYEVDGVERNTSIIDRGAFTLFLRQMGKVDKMEGRYSWTDDKAQKVISGGYVWRKREW